jgi:hypothetical protein
MPQRPWARRRKMPPIMCRVHRARRSLEGDSGVCSHSNQDRGWCHKGSMGTRGQVVGNSLLEPQSGWAVMRSPGVRNPPAHCRAHGRRAFEARRPLYLDCSPMFGVSLLYWRLRIPFDEYDKSEAKGELRAVVRGCKKNSTLLSWPRSAPLSVAPTEEGDEGSIAGGRGCARYCQVGRGAVF